MSNCSINGMVWNTCDTRPVVRLGDGNACVTAGVSSGIDGLTIVLSKIANHATNALLDITADQLVTAIKGGLLVDKTCLPKVSLSGAHISAIAASSVAATDVTKWVLGSLPSSDCQC